MTELDLVYDFSDYKSFLRSRVGPSNSRRGVKIAISKALKCQPTYVSQVINGGSHFSLEQGEVLSGFFGFTTDEKHYFLLLIQFARAGTKALEQYFKLQLDELRNRRLILTKRLGSGTLIQKEEQFVYYSTWQYAAIHMALTIPSLNTAKKIAEHYGISLKRTAEVLEFLCKSGLAKREGTFFQVGISQIRLGNDSPNILKHHTNWRMRAVESLDRESLKDLHYSAVVTLSQKDVVKIKDKLLETISELLKDIRSSKEEESCALTLDFFNLSHQETTIRNV